MSVSQAFRPDYVFSFKSGHDKDLHIFLKAIEEKLSLGTSRSPVGKHKVCQNLLFLTLRHCFSVLFPDDRLTVFTQIPAPAAHRGSDRGRRGGLE